MTSEGEMEAPDVKTKEGAPSKAQRKTSRKQPNILEASSLGLIIYAPESNRYPQTVTLDHISSGIKSKRYKFVYNIKRPEAEIWHLIEKQRIRFSEADLKVVQDETFRKIRQGQESPQQQQSIKKPTWNR